MLTKSNQVDPVKQIVREQRALAILRIVNRQAGRSSNELVLAECLKAFGLTCGHDELRSEVDGLERMGLLGIERGSHLWVVELTRRGAEVAEAVVTVEGVARVVPDCSY